MTGGRNASEGSLIFEGIFGVLRDDINQPLRCQNVAHRLSVGATDGYGFDVILLGNFLAGGVCRLGVVVQMVFNFTTLHALRFVRHVYSIRDQLTSGKLTSRMRLHAITQYPSISVRASSFGSY